MDYLPTGKVPQRAYRFLAAIAAATGVWLLSAEAAAQDDPTLARYDVTPQSIELIAPGTVIGKTAPAPYTHLIVKTFPRLGAGDLNAVNGMTKELASFLHTSLVAKVAPPDAGGENRYRLDVVATGFSTNIAGRGDTVLSPETEKKLGANLSFFARIVLGRCYEEQQKSRYIVRSDTMAIVDTPAIMLRNGTHRWVIIRYAILVSERSGRLDSLVWMIDRDTQGRYAATVGDISWLPPNFILDGVMHVDSDYFTFGVPSDLAFACVSPPKTDHSVPIPANLTPLAALPQFTREQARAAEIELWKVLQQIVSQR